MTGIKVARRRKGLLIRELADKVGVTESTIINWEKEIPKKISAIYLKALSETLDVTVEELQQTYPDDFLSKRDQRFYPCKYPPVNCIEVYRRRKRMSYRQLAEQLGVTTRERASKVCKAGKPSPKHLAHLAKLAGISPAEFMKRYSVEKGAV